MAKGAAVTNKQFSAIESRAKRMERTLAGVGASAFAGLTRGAIGVLAPLLTAGAAIDGTKKALAEFGDVADNAAASGLDSEFFQGLAYQASLGGVAVDQLSGALAAFAKNSGLAAEGKGKMVASLKALDPVLLENIRNAATQEERVKAVADALVKETDAAKRAAIATVAFGDAGAKLAGIFAGGSAQIEVMQVKAKNLGLIVDRELIARADQLGDEFDTTTKIVDLQLKQALVNLGPTLIWLTGLAGGIADQIGRTIDGFNSLDKQATSTLEGRLKGIDMQLLANDPVTSPNVAQAAGIDPQQAADEKAAIMAELRNRAMDNLRMQLSQLPPGGGADIPTIDEIEERNKAAQAAIDQAEAVKALIDQLKFEKSLIGESETDQAVATALREAGTAATADQRAEIESLIRTMESERAAIDANTAAMEAFSDTAKEALGGFISDMIEGKSLAESFGNVLGNIGNRLLDAGLGAPVGGTFTLRFAA